MYTNIQEYQYMRIAIYSNTRILVFMYAKLRKLIVIVFQSLSIYTSIRVCDYIGI